MKTSLLGALILGTALIACSGGSAGVGGVPVEEGEVVSPVNGVTVSATIVSVTLGDSCGGTSGGATAAGAPSSDASAGRCAPADSSESGLVAGGCGGGCQQSNVQLSFTSGAGASAKVEIQSVTLHEAATGKLLQSLTPSSPKVWTGTGYTAWNGMLKPSAETKASYNLSAPQWGSFGTQSSYSTKYKLRVTLLIDGAAITLESTTLNREPAVAT